MAQNKKCPNCGKIMRWNYEQRRWECPKRKQEGEKRWGCGYVLKPSGQQKLNV